MAAGGPCADALAHAEWKPQFKELSDLINFEKAEVPRDPHFRPEEWTDGLGIRADFLTISADINEISHGSGPLSKATEQLGMSVAHATHQLGSWV